MFLTKIFGNKKNSTINTHNSDQNWPEFASTDDEEPDPITKILESQEEITTILNGRVLFEHYLSEKISEVGTEMDPDLAEEMSFEEKAVNVFDFEDNYLLETQLNKARPEAEYKLRDYKDVMEKYGQHTSERALSLGLDLFNFKKGASLEPPPE